ncbi:MULTISPECIES: MarR family winged helix-turn-helix transcriptional regulator [Sphingobacterium]|uniref:MarR family winged helix-turn-helix transcriptional regulator n=1 Tax=Sphingobacterium TaxID=28453 RepID=UPI002242FFBE|nr:MULTISPECIES: MarR family transcriptional regulator [Sphingobacterium]MCW8311917.1 MarR family transcriptional regulator [Sphingobacterium sp. InxBP1]
MNKIEKDFYRAFTDLQCYILANMNKGNVNGVTATHYNIIEFIYRNQPSTGKQLAAAFNVSQAAISKHLKFLVEKGLINQQRSDADRRSYHLIVSETGKFIINNSEDFREGFTKMVSGLLTKDELKVFNLLLVKITTELKSK